MNGSLADVLTRTFAACALNRNIQNYWHCSNVLRAYRGVRCRAGKPALQLTQAGVMVAVAVLASRRSVQCSSSAIEIRLNGMNAPPIGPKEADIDQLADRLVIVRNSAEWPNPPDRLEEPKSEGAVFLIGAGCSRSTEIPLASEIVRTLLPRIACTLSAERDAPRFSVEDWKKALRWLQRRGLLSEGARAGVKQPPKRPDRV